MGRWDLKSDGNFDEGRVRGEAGWQGNMGNGGKGEGATAGPRGDVSSVHTCQNLRT